MKKSASAEIKRGQAISFRIPSDTPDHLLKRLQKIKETERRNFSSKIAQFVMDGVNQSHTKEREVISIPLPHPLNKSQRDWLKHEHSEALLGSIVYHLLTDPVRATSLLASLNSSSLDINEALYLQEEEVTEAYSEELDLETNPPYLMEEETAVASELDYEDDDLDSFDWENIKENEATDPEEIEENDLDSLLGDFLAKMNK